MPKRSPSSAPSEPEVVCSVNLRADVMVMTCRTCIIIIITCTYIMEVKPDAIQTTGGVEVVREEDSVVMILGLRDPDA